jgi:hypothetical protein
MPDLTGKSLKVAVASLPSSTSITAKDISGRHRLVIIQSNWQVCSQDPAPGAQFNGQLATFGVVKFGNPAPSTPPTLTPDHLTQAACVPLAPGNPAGLAGLAEGPGVLHRAGPQDRRH